MDLNLLRQIHAIFGREVMTMLILIISIVLTVTYKPNVRSPLAALLPGLVHLQATIGVIYWAILVLSGAAYYFSFPFILHPLLGLVAAVVAQILGGKRSPIAGLGKWAPLTTGLIVLVLALVNAFIPDWVRPA